MLECRIKLLEVVEVFEDAADNYVNGFSGTSDHLTKVAPTPEVLTPSLVLTMPAGIVAAR